MCSNLGDHQLEMIVCVCVCVYFQLPRHVQFFVILWTVCVCVY